MKCSSTFPAIQQTIAQNMPEQVFQTLVPSHKGSGQSNSLYRCYPRPYGVKMSLLTNELKFPSGQTVRKEKEKQKEAVFSQVFALHSFLKICMCFSNDRRVYFVLQS